MNSAPVSNLSTAIRQHAQEDPSRPYVQDGKRKLNYGEADALIDRCCTLLAEQGVKPGDVVSAVVANSVESVVLFMAALRYGAIYNPYPFSLIVADLKKYLDYVQPKIVFCQPNHYDALDEMGGHGHGLYLLKPSFLDDLPFFEGERDIFEPDQSTPACIYYSSGTTGNPKGIVFSHSNMLANVQSIVRGFRFDRDERHLILLPLGHTASINYSLLPCTLVGGSIVIVESFWKARSRFWEILRDEKITYVELVPSVLLALLNTPHDELSASELEKLAFIGCGSATLPQELQQRFIERFGVKVANLYGLSETGPSHIDYPLDPNWEPGSIGVPLDCNEAFILDESGEPLPQGEVGQIAIRGPNVFIGYHKNEALYEETVREGVFRTGDLGYVDPKGRYWFTGRDKDLLIKGGINIAPDEIDEVVYKLPGVSSAVSVGADDDYLGEIIHTYIVVADGFSITEADVKSHCRSYLSSMKVPDKVFFVDAIPTGPSGKFLRRALREQDK